ncbi:transporter substrate-binding domain-containing protein [Leucobacter sp. GX24907]
MKLRHLLSAAAIAALALTGCTNTDVPAEDSQTEQTSAEARTWDEIQESGVLRVGTIVDYPPNEFKTEDGEPTGWAVDLVVAIADELDLDVEWTILEFDSILPRIEGGEIDLGVGSFGDTVERQQVVDFLNYYEAGSLWATRKGENVDPDNACGLTVAVMKAGTQHLEELPARSDKCVEDGKDPIEILPFVGQPEVTNAVVLGNADAFTADSPITVDAISKLSGELVAAGGTFDTVPYGFPMPKGAELGEHAREALKTLIDDGRYLEIINGGESAEGAIETATINAGTQ